MVSEAQERETREIANKLSEKYDLSAEFALRCADVIVHIGAIDTDDANEGGDIYDITEEDEGHGTIELVDSKVVTIFPSFNEVEDAAKDAAYDTDLEVWKEQVAAGKTEQGFDGYIRDRLLSGEIWQMLGGDYGDTTFLTNTTYIVFE
tara:strand:+ start:5600 stop:6043 length:444 start_codon:yes stop_codon:yes gene_type:complete